MEARLESIDNQLLIIIQKYQQLKIEYEKNCKLLEGLTVPKVGEKRKRHQML